MPRERCIKVFVGGFPEGADVMDVASFVLDALSSYGGGLEPPNEDNNWTGDPMFNSLDVKRVRIGDNVFLGEAVTCSTK